MNTVATQRYTIIDGPSKFELMVSLFQGNQQPRHRLEFTLEDGSKILVAIIMIEQEDGSGESWNFKAYPENGHRQVEGYYSSKRRRGRIDLPRTDFPKI